MFDRQEKCQSQIEQNCVCWSVAVNFVPLKLRNKSKDVIEWHSVWCLFRHIPTSGVLSSSLVQHPLGEV